jgi:ABC-2 type transport system permease protein
MFGKIASFEFRYHLKSPVFWVTALLFALLTFGAVTSDNVQIGGVGNVKVNAPYAIAVTLMTMSIFGIFIMTAFVANVIVRDDETGFGPMVRSTRVSKFDYLFGRFTGAFAAGCLAFVSVPLAMLIGSVMPWLDPEKVGPLIPGHYLYVYFFLCVPTLFVSGAACFALATMTRSMLTTYVGVVVFLTLYLVTTGALDRPEFERMVAIFEPFGLGAFQLATKYWTATERNTLLPPIEGIILLNRIMWFGASFLLLAAAWALFRFEIKPKKGKKSAVAIDAESTAEASLNPLAPVRVRDAGGAVSTPLFALARFDMASVFRSPAFFVLVGIGFLNAGGSLWYADEFYGNVIHPVTRVMIGTLVGAFTFIPLIVAIYYAGELVWRDRERRVHEIVDASPAPDWAFVIPKIVAISLVLLATVAASVIAAVLVQLMKGYSNLEIGKYLLWYVAPWTVDIVLFAILAVFIQALVPHKFIGWLAMLVFIVAQIVLNRLGYEHNLYQYGASPAVPLSDMNGAGRFEIFSLWFRAYWSAIAVILVVIVYAVWRRGVAAPLLVRLRGIPRRLKGVAGLVTAAAGVLAVALGAFIFYNTNVLNAYRTAIGNDEWTANYEKELLKFERVPQPRITDVVLNVQLFPHEPRALTTGRYVIENRTAAPIDRVHVKWDRDLKMEKLDVSGARVEKEYEHFNYRIYAFVQPLTPGARGEVTFTTVREQKGFRNSGNETRIVRNGTFLNNTEIAPAFGISRSELLRDRAKRRKYGLPAEMRPPKLEDESARANNYLRSDSDWVTADITVTTEEDQIAIAPGYLAAESVADGRRTARYRTDAPILHFFSVQSAAYAVKKDKWHDVDLAVYYDPAHEYNVDRMIKGMKASLDYFTANFSPFQFRQLRILEFPDYAEFAQSFANTIPYSEGIGFIAQYKDEEKIDMVTYVTAHEVGHQWWAHQVIGGEMQGMTLLSETLAQYSALMVMEHLYGPEQIRKFLKFELDRYLRNRGSELIEELPLERVEDQDYIHYRKGSVAMYLLKDSIGEEAVNRALQDLLKTYAFKAAPYPTSRDLITRLRAQAKPEQQQIITDLFEKITLYDVKVTGAKKRRMDGGKWESVLEVDARKLHADGEGRETEAPLDETFDIGVFTAEPGKKEFRKDSVLSFTRQPVRSGKQTIRVVTDAEPQFAGVDPYIKHVDRNSDDNVSPVEMDETPARVARAQ